MSSYSEKERYIAYCQAHPEVPIFFRPQWLDIVCKTARWDVISTGDETNPTGFFVYSMKHKFSLSIISMPPLTPYLGIWYHYPNQALKKERKIAFELEVSEQLIDKMPGFFYFNMQLWSTVQNFLSFKWKHFKQSTKFTYVVHTDDSKESLWRELKDKTRNTIRKAQQDVLIEQSTDSALFSKLNAQTYQRQKLSLPYEADLINNLFAEFHPKNQSTILIAKNKQQEAIAGLFLVHDTQFMYCMAIGSDDRARKSGAISALIWEAILLAKSMQIDFDFEGSIMPNIEPFFRSFGGTQTAYNQIFKSRNRLTNALLYLTNRF